MSVLASVRDALSGDPGEVWQRELAFSLAAGMDESPSAATAKELRALMTELGVAGDVSKPKGDVSDDLESKRAARRAAAGS